MRIVHIAAEFAPIAKAGGLGEVLVGLSRELVLQNIDVDIILPKYSFIEDSSFQKEIAEFKSDPIHTNTMWSATVENCRLHLLEPHHPAKYFDRPNIYGYPDDVARFLYFSKAALEYLKLQNRQIDVLHLHEWHTAICAPLVKTQMSHELKIGKVLLTIHNLEYQGKCATWDLDAIGMKGIDSLKDDTSPATINLLKGGIIYSDEVNTVSPTYAKEILTPTIGLGLNRTLTKYREKLSGILNGIDQKLWNPADDKDLSVNFSSTSSLAKIEEAKNGNKRALEKQFHLTAGKTLWVGAITRLVPQKGPELLEMAMDYTLSQGGIFVLLGSSPIPEIQRHFEALKQKHKGNPHLLLQFEYNEPLAHLIYGALDFTLVPSHFEPCGLTQLISMRYGTLPIVHSTGGLKDTVFDCDDSTVPTPQRNGFTFSKSEQWIETLARAFQLKKNDPATFQSLIRHAMQLDSSWKKPTEQYLKLYRKIRNLKAIVNHQSSITSQEIF